MLDTLVSSKTRTCGESLRALCGLLEFMEKSRHFSSVGFLNSDCFLYKWSLFALAFYSLIIIYNFFVFKSHLLRQERWAPSGAPGPRWESVQHHQLGWGGWWNRDPSKEAAGITLEWPVSWFHVGGGWHRAGFIVKSQKLEGACF